MKQLLISTALSVCGTFCFSSQASNLDSQLQAKLDEAYYLYDSGHYQEALDNVHWLVEKGVALDHDFYGYRLGIVFPLWRNLAQDFEQLASVLISYLSPVSKTPLTRHKTVRLLTMLAHY